MSIYKELPSEAKKNFTPPRLQSFTDENNEPQHEKEEDNTHTSHVMDYIGPGAQTERQSCLLAELPYWPIIRDGANPLTIVPLKCVFLALSLF